MSNNLCDSFYSCKEIHKEGLEQKHEIVVSGQYIESELESELLKIAEQAKSPGYRAGKVPHHLIIKNYGEGAKRDVIKTVINKCADDFIKKNEFNSLVSSNIKVISLPDSNGQNNLICELSLEVMPEVPLIDLSTISIRSFEVKIEDSDVAEFITAIKSKSYNFIASSDDHKIVDGDRVVIDFEGQIKGKLFKGGSGKNFTAEVGSGKFLSGFDHNLIGMKKGGLKKFTFKIPEDYEIISLAGKEADFSVKVNDVLVRAFLNSDDELAKSNGFEDYIKFTDHIIKKIDFDYNEMIAMLMKKDLFDCIDKNYNFDLPNTVVKQEQERIKEFRSKDDMMDYSLEAKRRVKLGMLLMKFGQENKISIGYEDILNLILKQYVTKHFSLDDVLKLLKSNRKFYEIVNGQAIENKVTNYVMEGVSKEKQVVSVKELKELFNAA